MGRVGSWGKVESPAPQAAEGEPESGAAELLPVEEPLTDVPEPVPVAAPETAALPEAPVVESALPVLPPVVSEPLVSPDDAEVVPASAIVELPLAPVTPAPDAPDMAAPVVLAPLTEPACDEPVALPAKLLPASAPEVEPVDPPPPFVAAEQLQAAPTRHVATHRNDSEAR